MTTALETILGKPPPPRAPSGSARQPQLAGTFSDAAAEPPDTSPSVSAVASLSSETTAVWERLSNECACQCDYGCASCEPEDTAEWRRV